MDGSLGKGSNGRTWAAMAAWTRGAKAELGGWMDGSVDKGGKGRTPGSDGWQVQQGRQGEMRDSS